MLPSFWGFSLEDPGSAVAVLVSWRRIRAICSHCSSRVGNAAHVCSWKVRSVLPSVVVTCKRRAKVVSVCIRSLARPCQWARSNKTLRIYVLWGSGRRPSKTGIAHWSCVSQNYGKADYWSTYLQHILIVMSSHLLEFWPVCRYSSYTINSERWNLSKATWLLMSGHWSSIDIHRRSNSCFKFLFPQSRRRSRWIKTAFQTPTSTSCSRSTTSVSKILKLSSASLSENAFWNNWHTIN